MKSYATLINGENGNLTATINFIGTPSYAGENGVLYYFERINKLKYKPDLFHYRLDPTLTLKSSTLIILVNNHGTMSDLKVMNKSFTKPGINMLVQQ